MNSFDNDTAVLDAVPPKAERFRQRLKSKKSPVDFWHAPAVIAENNFIYKACRIGRSTSQLAVRMHAGFVTCPARRPSSRGRNWPNTASKTRMLNGAIIVLLRPWDEQKFLSSLRAAENTPRKQLKPDGNRAVIYCSTTDPYQVIRHPDPVRQRELAEHARFLVRRSLELIRDQSTLNVRILTRSPLARADFDLFRSFGKRLVFGMSLPTLRNDLAKVYEPKAPAHRSGWPRCMPRRKPDCTFMWPWRRHIPNVTKPICARRSKPWPNWNRSPFSTSPSTSGPKTWHALRNRRWIWAFICKRRFLPPVKAGKLCRECFAYRIRNCQGTRHRKAPAFVAGQIPRQPSAGRPDAKSEEIFEAPRTLVASRQRMAKVTTKVWLWELRG